MEGLVGAHLFCNFWATDS